LEIANQKWIDNGDRNPYLDEFPENYYLNGENLGKLISIHLDMDMNSFLGSRNEGFSIGFSWIHDSFSLGHMDL